jgi:hypothetical protein
MNMLCVIFDVGSAVLYIIYMIFRLQWIDSALHTDTQKCFFSSLDYRNKVSVILYVCISGRIVQQKCNKELASVLIVDHN